MRRVVLSLTTWAVVFALASSVRAQSTEDLSKTAAFVAALQNSDGGFSPKPGDPSTLGATSSAIRVLKNTHGSIPDVLACIKFVKMCYDASDGGFAQMPGGKTDVPTTATGLMAAAELKITSDTYTKGAIEYFSKNAKAYEQVRLAIAGMEAAGKPSPDFEAWTKQIEAMRNPDGTSGQGASQAFDTGGVAAALLRMGVKLDKKDAVLNTLRAGQHADGGWSKGEGRSDLEATYRVMRAFYMMKETPDLAKLLGFVASCRHSDGSYSVKAGGTDIGGSYYATTVIRWARLLNGEPGFVETAGFAPLFNGKDLTGWEGDKTLWSAKDGMIVGNSPGIKHNDFLATEKSYGDFVLKLTFRLNGSDGCNSGVQFRSVRVPGHEMSGYQADIGEGWWGGLYDESRRNKVLVAGDPKAIAKLNRGRWNEYVVRAMGGKIELFLNGVKSVEYTEDDDKIARDGRIALQIHAGGPMTVEFKDLWIQELPRPSVDNPNAPGFHLRTVEFGGAERKYSVYLPTGYDGTKSYPVILFLHGSGERGQDGVRSAQVGLGPAILANPGLFPAIAVFPQARETWSAGSDDAKAALAALEDVLSHFKAERDRVILTGLSMGGVGSWSFAAAMPDRFAAVVPICGRGKPETAAGFKTLPSWTIVGDADGLATVENTREMADTLRIVGSFPKESEYRDVGHNSWDRAYNDRAVIDWMFAQPKR